MSTVAGWTCLSSPDVAGPDGPRMLGLRRDMPAKTVTLARWAHGAAGATRRWKRWTRTADQLIITANTEVAGIGAAHRESFDAARLSPMTKTVPVATATGPKRRGPHPYGLGGMSSGASWATYGSASGLALIVTFPAGSQQAIASPPTAMTRLRNGAVPSPHRPPGGWNKTMSPRRGLYVRPTARTVMTCPALTVGSMLTPPWVNRSTPPTVVTPPHPPAPANTATTDSSDKIDFTRPILAEHRDAVLPDPAPVVSYLRRHVNSGSRLVPLRRARRTDE